MFWFNTTKEKSKDLATVITNLLSAVPWIGKSLVESNNITKYRKNYNYNVYNAISIVINGCKLYLNLIIIKLLSLNNIYYYINGVLNIIGKVSHYAIKKGWKESIDKNIFLNIPYSFLSMLMGLIDGDGYISITKSKKNFIRICLVISLHINDISTLNYIQSILKIGRIKTYPKSGKKDTCKLVINKTDLQVFLFPLLIYHNLYFLTKKRREQYYKALYVMENDIKIFSDIPNKCFLDTRVITSRNILELKFFNDWIVGFTIAEGSFLVKKNKDACFQLGQLGEEILLELVKLKFNSIKKIYFDKNNLYYQLSMSSKVDIQNVINFFSFSGNHPLIGLKLLDYQKWITYLRNSDRYGDLIFPN